MSELVREHIITALRAAVAVAAQAVGVAPDCVLEDDGSLIDEELLPAVSIRRGNDQPAAGDGTVAGVRRTLAMSVDIFAGGAGRQALALDIERRLRQGLPQLHPQLHDSDCAVNWEVDELGQPFMAARLHLRLDYSEDTPW